jgi:iron complex transport system permease protein
VTRAAPAITILAVALPVSLIAGILVGAVPISPGDVLGALAGTGDPSTATIIRDLRLPRVLAAALVGGALAVAGTLLQGLFRNPLADPYVTGTSAGAALGAVGVIALGGDLAATIVPLAATTSSLVAAIVVALGVGLAIVLGRRIDAFVFGEETAATLGVDPERTTITVIGAAALLTGAAVALAGLVGFVGLVIPHALRPIVGATHRTLAVASFLAGASVLVLADLGARSAFAPAELPVGVLTGLLGAPFFLVLLVRARRREVA